MRVRASEMRSRCLRSTSASARVKTPQSMFERASNMGSTHSRRDHVTVLRRDAVDAGPAAAHAGQPGAQQLGARHVVLVEGASGLEQVVEVVGLQVGDPW